MTNYSGEEPCCRCIHRKVCGAKSRLNEIQYSTTHPYFVVKVECIEFYNERLATMAERKIVETIEGRESE